MPFLWILTLGAGDCIKWHESKQISVELFSEMFCAGHSDGHQDACLGIYMIWKKKKKFEEICLTGFGASEIHFQILTGINGTLEKYE